MFSKLVLLASLILSVSCIKKPPQKVTALETFGLMNNGFAVLIDIRNDNKLAERALRFKEYHVIGSTQEWKKVNKTFPSNVQVILCANTEAIAMRAARHVSDQGLKTGYIANFNEWFDNKLPTREIEKDQTSWPK